MTHPTTSDTPAVAAGEARREHGGREYSISKPADPAECYPKNDRHTWSEFAGMAIELGGYSDITAVDPYTGRRFWLSHAFRCDTHAAALSAAQPGAEAIAVYEMAHGCTDCQKSTFSTAVRRLLDAMEAADWGPSGD